MRPSHPLACMCFLAVLSAAAVLGRAQGADFVPPPQAEREAVAALAGHGARVQIDGDYRVTSVSLGQDCTNDDLKLLAACERLTQVQIGSPKVTDEGIANLKGLSKLTSVTITSPGVTDQAVASLRTALPSSRITGPSFGRRGPRGGAAAPGAGGRPAGGFGPGATAGGFNGGDFRGVASRTTTLARNAAVQDDLKLTPEQRQQIATSDVTAFLKAQDEKVAAVLTPDQRARLRQIELQQLGAIGLMREDVATELKLSADQQTEIRKLRDETAASVRAGNSEALGQRNPGDNATELFAKLREKTAALNKQRDEKILAALNEEQRQGWQKLLGPKGPEVSTFAPAGPGGFAPRTPAESAKAAFDRYDTDKNGTITDAEFPETDRNRRSMATFGITLQFPVAREDFEKAYMKYAEEFRRRQ